MPKKQSSPVEKVHPLSQRAFPTPEQMSVILNESGMGFWFEKSFLYKEGIDRRNMTEKAGAIWRFRGTPKTSLNFIDIQVYLRISKAVTRGGYSWEQVPSYHTAFRS